MSLLTQGRRSKYFWPASALTPADMALVCQARDASSTRRIPITQLIARAVRAQYGSVAAPVTTQHPETEVCP